MKDFKKILKSIINVKIIISIIILVLLVVIILSPSLYFITIDDGEWEDAELGNPTTYTQNIKMPVGNELGGLTVDKDAIIKDFLTSLNYKDEEIANLTDEEIIEKLEINKKLKKNPKVTSLDEVTQAEILWCLTDVYSKYLDTPEELEKLLNAEIITQYPKMGQDDANLDGIIQFERHKTDGTSNMLTYIDNETFNSYVENGNENVFNYFTLDDQNNALVAVKNITTETITSNDDEMDISEYTQNLDESNKKSDGNYEKIDSRITTLPIYYKNVVEKYTMPFQYLWALLVIGEDKDFVLELADLVENSEITISIYDNITITINKEEYTYYKETRTDTYVRLSVPKTFGVTKIPLERYWVAEDNEHYNSKYPADYKDEESEYKITHTTTHEDNRPIVDLTKANVWIVDYSKEYTYQSSENVSEESDEKTLEDTEWKLKEQRATPGDGFLYENVHAKDLRDEAKKYIENNRGSTSSIISGMEAIGGIVNVLNGVNVETEEQEKVVVNIGHVDTKTYKHDINRKQTTSYSKSEQKYIAQTPINNPKVDKNSDEDNFVTLLCKKNHGNAKNFITMETASWLFEILEVNDDTKNMVDLTKYLLYKVTGENYGITEYNFSEFEPGSFTSATGSIYGNSLEEKVWFALKDLGCTDVAAAAAMGNFWQESGFICNNLENKSNKKANITDEEFTAQVNNGTISREEFISSEKYGVYTNGRYGYGLVQWTAIDRKTGLYDFAYSKEVGIDDEDMQIQYMIGELTPGGGADGCATYILDQVSTAYTPEQWMYSQSIEEATKIFCTIFEGPSAATANLQNRIDAAQKYYNEFQGREKPIGGDFYNIAKSLHDYIRENNYWYPSSQNIAAGGYVSDGKSQKHKIPIIGEPENQRYIDCSAYVSWVISEYTGVKQLYASSSLLNNPMEFQEVSLQDLMPGDILVNSSHTEIYAGNGRTFNAGSTTAIRSETSTYREGKFTKAFRAP